MFLFSVGMVALLDVVQKLMNFMRLPSTKMSINSAISVSPSPAGHGAYIFASLFTWTKICFSQVLMQSLISPRNFSLLIIQKSDRDINLKLGKWQNEAAVISHALELHIYIGIFPQDYCWRLKLCVCHVTSVAFGKFIKLVVMLCNVLRSPVCVSIIVMHNKTVNYICIQPSRKKGQQFPFACYQCLWFSLYSLCQHSSI